MFSRVHFTVYCIGGEKINQFQIFFNACCILEYFVFILQSSFKGRKKNRLLLLNIFVLLLFGVCCARPGESNTLSVQRPQPHTTNTWKEEKDKTEGDKKIMSRSCQQKSIGSALKTRQSHTIKHRVTKIVPKRHREGHKGSAILRSPTTRRR